MASALSRLNSSPRITKTVNSLTKLSTALKAFQGTNETANSLIKIGYALQNLSSVQKLSGLNSAINTLKKFPDVVNGLNTSNLTAFSSAMQPLADAIGKLGSVQKLSGLNSVLSTLKKLPRVTESLKNADLDEFAAQMDKVRAAVQPLATELEKVSSGFASFPSKVQKTVNTNAKLSASNNTASASFGRYGISISGALAKLTLFGYGIDRIARLLGSALADFNSYVENVNLFSVSLGEFTGIAAGFTQSMQDVLGVDASEAMRNMGVIQNLTTSFGVASDQAYILSKNLTQLGYDFASFYNISTEDAFTKLQAAISGELEPIRRLGVDISEARLQQELYAQGVNMSVSSLSQADKALLRYIAIMKQSTNAQTDMARTLNSPANMIRVFQAQLDLLSRSIGSLFIPMLNASLPPLIAVVQLIREAISAIAGLFGITVSFADVGSAGTAATGAVSSGLDDVGSSAASAAKEIKYLIGGFDELNVLPEKTSGGGGGGGGAGGGLGDLQLPEYDMFEGLANSKVAQALKKIKGAINKVLDALEPFMPLLKGIAAAVATAFAVKALYDFWKKLKAITLLSGAAGAMFDVLRAGALGFNTAFEAGEGLLKSFSAGLVSFRAAIPLWAKVAVVAGSAVGAFVTAYDAFKKLAEGSMSLNNALGITAAGLALFTSAAWLVAGPVGAVVTLVAGGVGAFFGYKSGIDAAAEAAYNASVEYQVLNETLTSAAEISEWAATAQENLSDKISIVSRVSENWTGIRTLVDDVFDLSEKTNKSASEMVELRAKVEMVNDLNLEGLQLQLSETGDTVMQSREEVDKLLDSLQQVAYQAAVQEVLTEAYKQQIEAQMKLQTATENYQAAVEVSNEAESARAQYLKDAGYWGAFIANMGLDETYTALARACDDANLSQQANKQAMEDAKGAYDNANAAVDTYEQKLIDIQNGNLELDASVQNSSSVIEEAAGKYEYSGERMITSADQVQERYEKLHQSMQVGSENTDHAYAASYQSINSNAQNSATEVSNAASRAASGVEDAASRSENALSSLPEKSTTWGSDFANKFAQGFRDAWNAAKDTFSNAAQWISDRFHFSVPDKGPLATADTWMPDMVDLFATTLTQSKPKLVSALDGVSQDMRTAFSAATAPHFGDVSAMYTVTPYAYSADDSDDDTDRIVAAIRALERAVIEQGGTTVSVDGKTLLTAVKRQARAEQMRTGVNPLL